MSQSDTLGRQVATVPTRCPKCGDSTDTAGSCGRWGCESQAWFWQGEWQEAEREAEADIRAGRVRSFDRVEELIRELNT